MRWNNHVKQCACICLVAMMGLPSAALAQRRGGRGRIVRPVAIAGGFYYQYYDPFLWNDYTWWDPWPYPRGYYGRGYGGESAARIDVTPRETEVYVDGYLAGTVDDFDGFAQRLRVEPGEHVIELYLEGHQLVTQSILFQPGATYRVRHTMQPLQSGEASPARPTPRMQSGGPAPPSPGPPAGVRGRPRGAPAPPELAESRDGAGTLSVRVQPADAVVLIDGERWEGSTGDARLRIQVSAGPHRIEIQRDGYQPFTTTIQVRPGAETPLNVSLTPKSEVR